MPSKSPAQRRLMAAVAHDPQFAAEVGIPQAVGEEFNHADHIRQLKREAKATPSMTIRNNKGGEPR